MNNYMLLCLSLILFCIGCLPTPRVSTLEDEVLREQKIVDILNQAVFYLKIEGNNNLDCAQAALRLGQTLNPEDPRIIDGLGAVEFRRGNLKKAKYFFREAIRRNPEYDRAYVHLALVAEKNGDWLATYQLLQIALKKNPLNAGARITLGRILLNSANGSFDRKRSGYEQLLMAEMLTGDRLKTRQHDFNHP